MAFLPRPARGRGRLNYDPDPTRPVRGSPRGAPRGRQDRQGLPRSAKAYQNLLKLTSITNKMISTMINTMIITIISTKYITDISNQQLLTAISSY